MGVIANNNSQATPDSVQEALTGEGVTDGQAAQLDEVFVGNLANSLADEILAEAEGACQQVDVLQGCQHLAEDVGVRSSVHVDGFVTVAHEFVIFGEDIELEVALGTVDGADGLSCAASDTSSVQGDFHKMFLLKLNYSSNLVGRLWIMENIDKQTKCLESFCMLNT